MFGDLIARVERAAELRAGKHGAELAERIAAELPTGVAVEADQEEVRISGRGLGRRFALDPALRWLLAGLRR